MRSLLILFATVAPAGAQEARMIDATKLSVADLMTLAAQDRAAPGPLACCDWGGLGCLAGSRPTGTDRAASDQPVTGL